MMGAPVKLYIYDLSKGAAKRFVPWIMGISLHGVWHTGVTVHGKEYFFGRNAGYLSRLGLLGEARCIGDTNKSGLNSCEPGTTILGEPLHIVDLGTTEMSESQVHQYLSNLSTSTYQRSTYQLFDHNCNHFSNQFSQYLTGKSIPDFILNMPGDVSNTPVGSMIRSLSMIRSGKANLNKDKNLS